MADDLWSFPDLPLLEGIHAVWLEAQLEPMVDWRSAASRAGLDDLDDDQVLGSILRLHNGGYVAAKFYREGSGRTSLQYLSGPTAEGLRAVRAWPSNDLYQEFLKALDIYEGQESDPESQSRTKRLGDSFRELGVQASAGILAEFVKRLSGGW
jgi:hypothetical protein